VVVVQVDLGKPLTRHEWMRKLGVSTVIHSYRWSLIKQSVALADSTGRSDEAHETAESNKRVVLENARTGVFLSF
jgi:hypothetical protein